MKGQMTLSFSGSQLLATLNVPGVRGTTWAHAEDLVTPATLQAAEQSRQTALREDA